jgi:hypothetical protein
MDLEPICVLLKINPVREGIKISNDCCFQLQPAVAGTTGKLI